MMTIKTLLSGIALLGGIAMSAQASAETFNSKGTHYGDYTKEGCYWQTVAHWGVQNSWGYVQILLCQTGTGPSTVVEFIAEKKTSYYYNSPTCTIKPGNIATLEGGTCSSYRLSRK
ncbi:hypothetical protein QFX18_18135 [Saccharophagus degradans]|uniref:hypothetical protein n=1 Tax=Saccharophagus degradans TaxID=86304 RepID=UPI002477E07F|nr:hypothetical protein [Saccharophagus degradans]WGO97930.1 hypothetical protein QFX18_18135 [Saccharophagus degradans]